ncbi:MAG: hypothetical protein ACT4O6_12660 [Reyranella sp.]
MQPSTTFPDLTEWRPAIELWLELAEKNRHLRISPTVTAWYGFFRNHKDALTEAGVVIRLTSRNWLADPVRFANAIQAIKCGLPIKGDTAA